MSPDDFATALSNAPLALDYSTRQTLHLGVLVQPYRAGNGRTTGDVAEILEAEYGIMQRFVQINQQEIVGAVAKSFEGAMESLLMGKRVNPWGYATEFIQTHFRDFISSGEAEHVGIPGTPTMAAQRGVNHRRKHPYRKSNPQRVSFRDTGLYMTSFRAWID